MAKCEVAPTARIRSRVQSRAEPFLFAVSKIDKNFCLGVLLVTFRSTNGPTTRTNGTNGDTNDRRGTMRRRQQEAAEYNNTEPTHNKFNENLTRFQQPQQ